MESKKKELEKILEEMNQDEDKFIPRKWNECINLKILLLSPLVIFLITYLKINKDKTILDLFVFLFIGLILIMFGVGLNFMLSKK